MKNNKENNFDIVRLIAAFLVFTGHAYVLVGNPPPVIIFQAAQRLGIIIFFTIGGYLITESWKRDSNYFRYIIKRVFRIFPALIACVLITAFLLGPILSELSIQEYFTSPITWGYLKNIVLYINYSLPGVFESNPYPYAVNGSLWSLPVEFFMYLMIPFIYEIGKRKNGLIHALFSVIICGISIYISVFQPEWRYVIYGTDVAQALSIIPYYFIGSLVSTLEIKTIWNSQVSILLLIIFQGLHISNLFFSSVLSYLIIPYVVFSFAFAKKLFPSSYVLDRAQISYGMYLYGFVIQQMIIKVMNESSILLGNGNIVLFLSIIVTGIFAFLSCYLIEKPAIKIQKKILINLERK